MSWGTKEHEAHRKAKAQEAKTETGEPIACMSPKHFGGEPSMRNWVIKTLCGFDVHLLKKFKEHFPNLADEFDTLHDQVVKLLVKCREENHKYTKNRHP